MNVLEESVKTLENGWCKSTLKDGDKFCAVGAIAHNLGVNVGLIMSSWEDEDAYGMVKESSAGKALAQEIVESDWLASRHETMREAFEWDYKHGNYDEIIYGFNDSQSTVEPVLEMMKHAAKRLDA